MNGNRQTVWGREAPAEVAEQRKAGIELDVQIPVKQAAWAGVAWGLLLLALLSGLAFWGWRVLLLVALVVGCGTFWWWVWKAARYAQEYDDGSEGMAVTLPDLFTGCGVSAFPAFLAWCLWRLVVWIAPGVALWPEWLQRIGALASSFFVVFCTVFAALLTLAFAQELAQRSPFQERHVWKAIGDLLEYHGKRWEPERERIITVHSGGTARPSPGPVYSPAAVEEPENQPGQLTELEAFIILAGREGTLSRRQLAGQEYGGWELSEDAVKRLVGKLVELGYVDTSPGVEAAWAPSWSPAAVLAHLSPYPTPQRWWEGQDGPSAPPHQAPHPPTPEEEDDGERAT